MRTSYSRRELYALGEPLGESATHRKADGGLILGGGGSAPAPAPQPTTQTVTNTNIPEYAKPYVESMLGATQQQLFNMGSSGEIQSIKPYVPYSQNPSDYVAGFSPMQQQSQQAASDLQVPGQFDQATQGTLNAGLGGFGVAMQANPYGFQNQVGGYMNPYMNQILAPQLAEANRNYDISGMNQQAKATQAGAFGGSREAIMAAENERNRNTGLNQIYGQGLNTAFTNAQNQYNQNLGTQLQGYGLAGQQAGQLANIGGQQLGAQQGIIGLQNQMGAQQQQQQQNIVNQAIQNYATAQQYPQQQLAFMNSMLRGLPLQTSTVQGYQAAPSSLSQVAGLGTAAAGAYGLANMGSRGYAEGGEVERPAGLAELAIHRMG